MQSNETSRSQTPKTTQAPGLGAPAPAAPPPAKIADVRALLDTFARTGEPEAFKALLNTHSGTSFSVGGAGSGGIDIPWSKAAEILARAGISSADIALLQPTYERGLRKHFETKLAEAAGYAQKYDIGMMEHVLTEAARHAEKAGVVTAIADKIETFKAVQAPRIYEQALAAAKEATTNPEAAYKLSGALGNMTTYGALAGMTVAQVEAAKQPFMQTLVTQFQAEIQTFSTKPITGYFRNDIKSRRDGLIEQAKRVCANDPAMFKAAKEQIIEASRACARVTAFEYLKDTDALTAGQSFIQAQIYARMGGLTSWFANGNSEYRAARSQFIRDVGPMFGVSYLSWRLINIVNFPRWVSFYG